MVYGIIVPSQQQWKAISNTFADRKNLTWTVPGHGNRMALGVARHAHVRAPSTNEEERVNVPRESRRFDPHRLWAKETSQQPGGDDVTIFQPSVPLFSEGGGEGRERSRPLSSYLYAGVGCPWALQGRLTSVLARRTNRESF